MDEGAGRREEGGERTRRRPIARRSSLFAGDASVASEPMATPDRIVAAINAAKLSSEGTRYAPALKLASQIISASTLPRREVVLISDFQKVGWANRNEITFPAGHRRSRRSTSAARRRRTSRSSQVTTRSRQHGRSRSRDRRGAARSTRARRRRRCRRRWRSADATCRRSR